MKLSQSRPTHKSRNNSNVSQVPEAQHLDGFLKANRIRTLLWLTGVYTLNNLVAIVLAYLNRDKLSPDIYPLLQAIRSLVLLLQIAALGLTFKHRLKAVQYVILVALGLTLSNGLMFPNADAMIAVLSLVVSVTIATFVVSALFENTAITLVTSFLAWLGLNVFMALHGEHPNIIYPLPPDAKYAIAIAINFAYLSGVLFVTSMNTGIHRLKRFITDLIYIDLKTSLYNERQYAYDVQKALENHTAIMLLCIDFKNLLQLNRQHSYRIVHPHFMAQVEVLKKLMFSYARLYRLEGPVFATILTKDQLKVLEVENTLADISSHLKALEINTTQGSNIAFEHQWLATQYPQDGTTAQALIDNLYHLKYSPEAKFVPIKWYDQSAFERVKRTLSLEADLKMALDNHDLTIALQPQLSLATGTLRGFEVLARWQHPEYGWISPGEFIPMAERLGLMNALTHVVIEKTLALEADFNSHHLPMPPYAINIAASSIADGSIFELTAKKPQTFEIEITESTLMELTESAKATLKQLKSRGFTLAIDDFGTGFSNLEYLHALDVDYLKIDKRFVDSMMTSEKALKLVEALIGMAHTLDISVIAEGVETQMQYRVLEGLKCDYVQGYWYSKPLPPEALIAFVKNGLVK